MCSLTAKENLYRVITHRDAEYIPVRRLDGSIPGMARLIYKNSRGLLSGTDRWGVTWAGGIAAANEWEPEIQGYPIRHPLQSLGQMDTYPFPDPNESGIMDGLLTGIDQSQVLLVGEMCFPLQDRAILLMGMEKFFMAAVDDSERVQMLLHRIADYHIGITHRFIDMGVDIIRGLDDYGGQKAVLLGPKLWRKLIKPELARIVRAVKDMGALFWLHCCGHIMEILPDLVEIGVDLLDPIQVQANNQAEVKRLYGDKLCLIGGVDTQQVLTLGTPEQVTREVRTRIQMLGPGGGYILAPDTLIKIPSENYRAYLEAGLRYGRYPLKDQ